MRLDRGAQDTLGSQLQRELREAIRSGRLEEGERLPSSRVLAAELGVSRGLVLDCYEQLSAEGYLTARSGSATRVATRVAARAAPRPGDHRVTATVPRLAVDFRPGVPDLTSFPLHDWLWAVGGAARQAPTAAMGYGDSRGAGALREVLAAYLRRVRGGSGDAERMLICTGYAQGINLVVRWAATGYAGSRSRTLATATCAPSPNEPESRPSRSRWTREAWTWPRSRPPVPEPWW